LPALDVAGPGDERFIIPEADGFAVPARYGGTEARHAAQGHIVHVELTPHVDAGEEVVCHAGRDLHQVWRHHKVLLPHGEHVVAAHEALRPAEGRGPQRVTTHLVVGL